MKTLIHKILYKTLPLEGYLRAVSRMFFLWQRLGIGRYAPATEYVYHLPQLVHAGDTAIDIGANLGYYARTLSRQAGGAGRVYAVEPAAVATSRSSPTPSAPRTRPLRWPTIRRARRATSARGRTS